jgi:hypothetical protein
MARIGILGRAGLALALALLVASPALADGGGRPDGGVKQAQGAGGGKRHRRPKHRHRHHRKGGGHGTRTRGNG